MKLKVLDSGSSGNCYLLENDSECLVLEAGLKFKDVQKLINYETEKIVGCLVTHEHGDHARYVQEFLKASVDVYASVGTCNALNISSHRLHGIKAYNQIRVGGFSVLAFKTEHDSAEPLGFLIKHKDFGTLLFATDTYYLRDKFAGLNHILIECNYSLEILDENVANGLVSGAIYERIIKSHMEISTCKEFLMANDLQNVHTIVLLHLSKQNGNAKRFVKEIKEVTGKIVHAAYSGMDMHVEKNLF